MTCGLIKDVTSKATFASIINSSSACSKTYQTLDLHFFTKIIEYKIERKLKVLSDRTPFVHGSLLNILIFG